MFLLAVAYIVIAETVSQCKQTSSML